MSWENRCTCGSGGHPRRCELHPDRYELHCLEMSYEVVREERDAALEAAKKIGLQHTSVVSDLLRLERAVTDYFDAFGEHERGEVEVRLRDLVRSRQLRGGR